ncbi:MAG: PASTA domain-containing protein [Eggerthellaceae bacterium]|nr:PASTA domain-containing protein [Eggerthellaceae bacterium]
MKGHSRLAKAIAAVMAAMLVAGVLVMAGCSCSSTAPASSSASSGASTASDKLTVPNVVSLTQADADKALAAAGFSIGSVSYEASDTVPKGAVVSQDPAALSAAEAGSKVNLVISSGKAAPADVKVPDLKGKTQADAEKALADAKLVGVASNPEETDEVAPGQVFKQSVAAGTTVKEGTRVAFTVATAPAEATVPNVVGKVRDDAKAQITAAKLGFDYTVAYDDKVAEGCVISQSVAAGTKVKSGTTVSVVVSLGAKPAADVKVPDVTTFSWSDAEKALKSAGLQARYTGDPSGVVVAQDVAAGTMVAPGTMVTVTLESPVGTVEVPDLVGLSVTSAEIATDQAGLSLDIVEGGEHGTVTEQWPEAGDQVPPGTTVNIKVDSSDFAGAMSTQSEDSSAAASSKSASADAGAFAGKWAAGDFALTVEAKDGKVHVKVASSSDAATATTWEYDCTLDGNKLVAKKTGVKTEPGSDPAYKDGSATFAIDDAGKLTWKDDNEDAGKGLAFEKAKQ